MRKCARRQLKYQNTWSWERIAPTLLIRSYDQPILLIHDQHDEEVPVQHAQILQSNNVNAQLVFTQKQTHRKILRDKVAASRLPSSSWPKPNSFF
ncbi:alpha/beta hydrolase [Trinickia soli]|uniref:Peptidase S33 tripeptidyl aminopeptidase-like C-terminal domain-containing protein n=1 Tax=Trinickia soli TaxID=380675 RepID=A0A2N7W878_9BURK|nr:alpha/beta hydrolase [Trinickia soli]PMS25607.1 hypothetical protein C0Z19_08515 [Trinickia soli]